MLWCLQGCFQGYWGIMGYRTKYKGSSSLAILEGLAL